MSFETVTRILRPWFGLGFVCAGFSLHPTFFHTFWTREYLPNILQQAATNIILAVGMTFVIITGGIDLSVGSVMALCGVSLGLAATTGLPPFLSCASVFPLGIVIAGVTVARLRDQPAILKSIVACVIAIPTTLAGEWFVSRLTSGGAALAVALLVALAMGSACGLANGLLVTLGRVPPFVVTLGMLTAARGFTLYVTDGNSVSGLPPPLGQLGEGIPLIVIALSVVVLGSLLLNTTNVGRTIAAIGGNELACRLSGVNVASHKTLAYVLSGLVTAIAAIVLTAKFRLADTNAGAGAELNAIAAVVIGGTSLSGGQGSIIGSLIGALTIAVLNAGLVLVGVRDTLQGVVIGAVIVATVMIDQLRWTRNGMTR